MGPGSSVTGVRLEWSADALVEAGVRQWCMDVLKLAGSNGYSPAQHILNLHFNSLSRTGMAGSHLAYSRPRPRTDPTPTQPARQHRPRGVYSIEHALSLPTRGTCHIYGSVCASKGTRPRGLSFRCSRLVASTGHAVFYVSGNLLHSNTGSCRNYDGWNGAPS